MTGSAGPAVDLGDDVRSYIKRLVDGAPPLTDAQRSLIASVTAGSAS